MNQNPYLNALKVQANRTFTENLASTPASSLSHCLDLFATIGALRSQPEADLALRFSKALAEDADLALKTLFFARDIRGGLGERRVFRVLLKWLASNDPATLLKNLQLVPEYGRFDDWLALLNTPLEGAMLALLQAQWQADLLALKAGKTPSLLAKWLPSVNATKLETIKNAKRIARSLGLPDASYRRALSRLRASIRLLENHLREKDYNFDYQKQPSRALLKYRKAFYRNDPKRYTGFLEQVEQGKARMNTSTLTPYDLVLPSLHRQVDEQERRSLNASWQALADYGVQQNALCVIDGSGSMYNYHDPMPAAAALALGLYFAERNQGLFHQHFITFSHRPQLVQIQGRDLMERLHYCMDFNEVANTNLQAVFQLILDAAISAKASQKEMPDALYIISDMEFDACAEDAELSNFEAADALFQQHGYRLPQLVFWNVASRRRHQPVTRNQQGVTLVGGYNPKLFEMLASGQSDPHSFMIKTLGQERYAPISA